MFAMGSEKLPASDSEADKSKKELLIDELEQVLELKKQAKLRKKELQAIDIGELIDTDPEMTPERWKQEKKIFKEEMKGKDVVLLPPTARGKQVNEVWAQYLETLWVINDLAEKEQELREKIEIEKMREIPLPADLPIAIAGKTAEFVDERQKKYEVPRDATEITLARVKDYEELAAATEQEGDEKFLSKTRELWREIVVHGIAGKDKKGNPILMNFSDVDGNCAVSLMKFAGISIKHVEYVEKSKFIVGKINLDTGDRHGVVVEDQGRTAFFDHHAAESGSDTCATKIVYDALIKLGLLEKQEWLDKLVEFVNYEDNMTYPSPNPVEDYKNSWQSLLGLGTFIKFEKLADFFQHSNKLPHEPMSADELTRAGLDKKGKERKREVEHNVKMLEGESGKEAEANDFVIETQKYGKIIVDIVRPDGKKLLRGRGFSVAKAFGFGGYLLWAPSKNSFFFSTIGKLGHSFSQGFTVRETMWIKPEHDPALLAVTLEQILTTLSDGNLRVSDKLKKYFKTGKLE
ncbi:MAG: hypothetical protein V1902_02475 [Candidatus Falkowbacteria bacterium]